MPSLKNQMKKNNFLGIMLKSYFTFLVILLFSQNSFSQLTVSLPDSSYTFFSTEQVTETTIPVWVSNAETSHQAISFDFNLYYKLGNLRVTQVSMIQPGNFEFSVNPDGQNENEVVSGAGVLNSELVGNVHLLNLIFENPSNLPSGFEKKIEWVNFRFTPKQPQVILESGVLTLAKNGDFDKNNEIDSTDAVLLLKKLTSKQQFSGFQTFVSDFDENGKIQTFDCAKILEFANFGTFTPQIFSFTISEFEAENFAVNSSPYSFKINLNNSVSLNSVSTKIIIPNQDFAVDSVKFGNDFSTFLQSYDFKIENEFTNINLGLASSNKLLNGNLELVEIFLTPLQTKNSSQLILSELTTNIEPEQTDRILEIEILENSVNDTLNLFFLESKFFELNEQFVLSIFTPRISSFWQIKNFDFEIHFPTSKFNLVAFSSNYFEEISPMTQTDKIEIRGKTNLPKDFTGKLFEFIFSTNEEKFFSKDSFKFEIQELQTVPNFPFELKKSQVTLTSYKKGDFDANNFTNQDDVRELMTKLSKFETFDEYQIKTVDFDNSESITSFDASLFLRFLNGESTNISKGFSDSHFLKVQDSILKDESFLVLFSLAQSENIRSVRGRFSFDTSAIKYLRINLLNSNPSSEFAWNDFGFCFASSSEDAKNELFSLELLPLQTGNFEVKLTDFEINGLPQPSQSFTIDVESNFKNGLSPFGIPYPNPIFNGFLNVDVIEDFDLVKYEIFNLLGKSVVSEKATLNKNRLVIKLLNQNKNRLASGVYFLKLSGKTQTSTKEQTNVFTILN